MQSFTKTSFLMVLLTAVFSVGFSNANPKTPAKYKTITKVPNITYSQKNFKAIPLQCRMQLVSFLAINSFGSDYSNQNMTISFTSDCEPSATNTGSGGAVIISGDCTVTVVNSDGSVFIQHPDGSYEFHPGPSN